MDFMEAFRFYKGKRVLVTGHTGFKGSWLCRALIMAGAQVTGYALEPAELFKIAGLSEFMRSEIGDIRDLAHLMRIFKEARPEIVFHLAAQPIVRESYKTPVYTYETNVMGTVNVMECVRLTPSVKSVVNVTTDKVYENREWEYGYRETDRLGGYDPYSNSKACSELVTASYRQAFLDDLGIAVSTCRAGNVIGGGDFAKDRIIPDCVRAVLDGRKITVRNPLSTRPFQHVIEPVAVYMMVAAAQYGNGNYADKARAGAAHMDRNCLDEHNLNGNSVEGNRAAESHAEKDYVLGGGFAGSYNVGPDDRDCVTTGDIAELFCKAWGSGASWESPAGFTPRGGDFAGEEPAPHEASFLKLDCSKLKAKFNWRPTYRIHEAVAMAVEWYKAYARGEDANSIMDRQIEEMFQAREI